MGVRNVVIDAKVWHEVVAGWWVGSCLHLGNGIPGVRLPGLLVLSGRKSISDITICTEMGDEIVCGWRCWWLQNWVPFVLKIILGQVETLTGVTDIGINSEMWNEIVPRVFGVSNSGLPSEKWVSLKSDGARSIDQSQHCDCC